MQKYPRQLSAGANNTVIALSESEVGKLYVGDTRSDIGSEAEKMKAANAINGLVVRFTRLDFNESLQAEMLVMERLYPLDSVLMNWNGGNCGWSFSRMNCAKCISQDLYTVTYAVHQESAGNILTMCC